jgi:hypothetical protein
MRVLAASICLFSIAALAQQTAEPRLLDRELLALCRSIDRAARLYCLHSIAAQGDPGGQAKETIAAMADHDSDLRDEAARTYAHLYGTAPPARPLVRPLSPNASGDPMRVILAPTAFTRPQDTTSFNAFELGTLTFDHGITPNIALGLHTAIPIGAVVFGPTARIGLPFQGGAFGLEADAILFAPFVGSASTYLVLGGGPILTLGNPDRYVNFGVLSYFLTSNGDGVIIPHAGFSMLATPGVRIGAEVWLPGAYGSDVRDAGIGKIGVILWGVRLFGQSVWGDIALADLICDGCGDLYRVLPLGIPFLNLGVGW